MHDHSQDWDTVIDDRGREIQMHSDRRRIDGLVAEDRVRTLTLFRPGNFAEHPTAAIDIAPFHDLVQGLGTHVKSIKLSRESIARGEPVKGTLELASTREMMRLDGHHRYIIMAYEPDGKTTINGKEYEVRRYHTAVEMIASPATFAAFRGSFCIRHLDWFEERFFKYKPHRDTIAKAQDHFGELLDKFSHLFGLAKPSVKLSINSKTDKTDNHRVQSALPIHEVRSQLAREGDYHGRFVQPNYREWHEGEEFYGLKLPWFTISRDKIYSKIGDPAAELSPVDKKKMQARGKKRAEKKIVATPQQDASDDSAEHIEKHQMALDTGLITIARRRDGRMELSAQTPDSRLIDALDNVCRAHQATYIEKRGVWLTDRDTAREILRQMGARKPKALPSPAPEHVDELPEAPRENPLRQRNNNPELFDFDTIDGKVTAYRLPFGNWVLLDNDNERIARRIEGGCSPYAPTAPWDGNHKGDWTVRYNASHKRPGWLVRDHPSDLIQRVAVAIQQWSRPRG